MSPWQHGGNPYSPMAHLRLNVPAGAGEHAPRLRESIGQPGDVKKAGCTVLIRISPVSYLQ
jgi:hypothetical protein